MLWKSAIFYQFQILVNFFFNRRGNFQKNYIQEFHFPILMFHKLSLESCEVPHKNWDRSVQPFWRFLDTNAQIKYAPFFSILHFHSYSILHLSSFLSSPLQLSNSLSYPFFISGFLFSYSFRPYLSFLLLTLVPSIFHFLK